MEKILKKYTSIPQHLYVNRSADEQLKRIVDEMQRPGYVLVARQMGKTNLLFNAKRTLEHEKRLFVYVDLSNVFEQERDCYRNIIDNVLEPNEVLFEEIEAAIGELRSKNFPPHKEYSKCLRVILNFFEGDVVIVLDEIDALRSVDYSDNIFAQIRSNYFSRTNFPVFERLTYVLSGVIEPTELIKDRNKSPFNIGDKIYLEDFSFEEHNSFIEKSKLKVPEDISNEIYRWTNGNPRLTFDICSSLENLILEDATINSSILDDLIKRKYLTTYDIAPIDHIRELVKTDKKVRNAVLLIQQNKNNELSDEIKKKLYLYGIINSRFNEASEIKNLIIKKSLSEEWIKAIDKETQDNYSYGLDKMGQGEFKEAINALTDFILNSNPSKIQIEACNYNIGFALYKTGNLNKAIQYFNKNYNEVLYKRNSKSFLGICKIGTEDIQNGIDILEEVIVNKTHDFAFRNAMFNLATNISSDNSKRALLLYDELYNSTFESKDDIGLDEINKLRTLIHYYKALIYIENGDESFVIPAINKALTYATVEDSLYLKYVNYNISSKDDLVIDIVNTIVDEELKFDTKNDYDISFSRTHLLEYLCLCYSPLDKQYFEKLLEYSYKHLFNEQLEKHQIAYQATTARMSKFRLDLLNYILESKNSMSESVLCRIYNDIALNFPEKNFFKKFNNYIKLFKKIDSVSTDDINLYSRAIKNYYEKGRFDEALQLCEEIETKVKNTDDELLKFELLIIDYFYAYIYYKLQNKKVAIQYAEKTIKSITYSKRKTTSAIGEEGLKSIIEQMEHVKKLCSPQKPIINSKKISRNDIIKVKYKDGRIVENKYKKLSKDIKSNKCIKLTK